MTDEQARELVTRWQRSRDEDAIAQLLRQYRAMINQHATSCWRHYAPHWRKVVGWFSFEDIKAGAEMGLVNAASTYDGRVRFSTYAWQCIRNGAYRCYSLTCGVKWVGVPTVSLDGAIRPDSTLTLHDIVGYRDTPETIFERAEFWETIKGRVHPRQFTAIEQHFRYGHTDYTVAKRMRCTYQAVSLRRKAGLRRLRQPYLWLT